MKVKWLLALIPIILPAVLLFSGNSTSTVPIKISQAINAKAKVADLATVATKISIVPASEKDEKDSFESELSQILDEMPTMELKSAPKIDADGDIHGFQADELAEGKKLTELRELTLKNENFISSSQQTYALCAERASFDKSVRAVCYMRAMEISIKLKNPEIIVGLNVPNEVRELALKLVN